MAKNNRVWNIQKKRTKTRRRKLPSEVFSPNGVLPMVVSSRHSYACVFLFKEKAQYSGVIRDRDSEIYVVSAFDSKCQPKKSGWYFCSVPRKEQKPVFFFSGGRPVFTVEVYSTVKSWASDGRIIIIVNDSTLSLNRQLQEKDNYILFGENGDYFIRIKNSYERKKVARRLSEKEKETMGFENLWTKKKGFIFSPQEIVSSSLSKEEIIKIIFG